MPQHPQMENGLTPPGQLFRRDFRLPGKPQERKGAVTLLQWNIERGYQLPGIIGELRAIDADILSLQEVDVGCERSGSIDTGVAIAQALQLNYVFLSEFEELHSPLRDARSQGGGVHGNAILTKFDISEVAVVPHRTHPVDWNDPAHALAKREPRRGQRAVLRAVVTTPQGPLVVYNAHLEVFCGLLARISQLADMFADARRMADRGLQHQAILGDLNTMAHGIARLSRHHCNDHMRFRTIGLDEAAVWHRHVLPVTDPRYAAHVSSTSSNGGSWAAAASLGGPSADDAAASSAAAAAPGAGAAATPSALPGADAAAASPSASADAPAAVPSAASPAAAVGAGAAAPALPTEAGQLGSITGTPVGAAGVAPVNQRLMAWGLNEDVARDAVNPGFADPFPRTTITLDNPQYRWFGLSLMKGKLDWVLLRRLKVAGTAVGNHDYSLSDHKWLAAEVTLA